MDDEEDVDEDTFDEFVDPWGIINMPIKVRINKVIIKILYPLLKIILKELQSNFQGIKLAKFKSLT